MKISNWEKRPAVAQVSLALKTYALSVEKNTNVNVQGDLIASWNRTGKKYLVSVVPRITRADTKSDSFKSTLAFCRANNLKFLVIAWEYDNKLFDFTMDAEPEDYQEFKIVQYSRLDTLKKEYIDITTKLQAA